VGSSAACHSDPYFTHPWPLPGGECVPMPLKSPELFTATKIPSFFNTALFEISLWIFHSLFFSRIA
jgi:hypothetical protein